MRFFISVIYVDIDWDICCRSNFGGQYSFENLLVNFVVSMHLPAIIQGNGCRYLNFFFTSSCGLQNVVNESFNGMVNKSVSIVVVDQSLFNTVYFGME